MGSLPNPSLFLQIKWFVSNSEIDNIQLLLALSKYIDNNGTSNLREKLLHAVFKSPHLVMISLSMLFV